MTVEEHDDDALHQVQQYRKTVLLYEALDAEIDQLLAETGGASDNMTEEQRALYRELAAKRDNVHNEMRIMEQALLEDIDDSGDA